MLAKRSSYADKFALLFICVFTLALICAPVKGKQISFNKKATDSGYQFSYQWLDINNNTQTMNFTLSNEALFQRFRELKPYQANFARKAIIRKIKKTVQQQPIPGVQVQFKQVNNDFTIEVLGTDSDKVNQAYQQLAQLEQQARQDYFNENYYQAFTNHDQQTGIKVDHVRIANGNVMDLKPLKPTILEKASIQNVREVTNFVLGFVQSIPYATLENRLTSSGAGFNPPLKVLWENQGDCDSKMTLTAALLRSLMPRIEMALIFIDQHAFIGIAIPANTGETSVEYQGINYLLAEPTGPMLLPLGKLAPESELAINQGRYVIETYHAPITVLSPENADSSSN